MSVVHSSALPMNTLTDPNVAVLPCLPLFHYFIVIYSFSQPVTLKIQFSTVPTLHNSCIIQKNDIHQLIIVMIIKCTKKYTWIHVKLNKCTYRCAIWGKTIISLVSLLHFYSLFIMLTGNQFIWSLFPCFIYSSTLYFFLDWTDWLEYPTFFRLKICFQKSVSMELGGYLHLIQEDNFLSA